jgi:broad specificity phosphatase PhoE
VDTKLYLARHGECEANVLWVFSNQPGKHSLTDLGREQARALAERMVPLGIESISCSPLNRALETAQIVAEACGLSYEVRPDLVEFDVGAFEGTDDRANWDVFFAQIDRWWDGMDLDVGVAGGESPIVMAKRLGFELDRFATMGGTHLAVTHGGLIRCGLPLLIRDIEPGFMKDHYTSAAGYSVLDYQDDAWHIAEWDVH